MNKRPSCPFCGSLNLRHFERAGTYKCDSCKASRFTEVVYRYPNPSGHRSDQAYGTVKTRRKFAGSGVIAGRIEIGRGMKWGSGLV